MFILNAQVNAVTVLCIFTHCGRNVLQTLTSYWLESPSAKHLMFLLTFMKESSKPHQIPPLPVPAVWPLFAVPADTLLSALMQVKVGLPNLSSSADGRQDFQPHSSTQRSAANSFLYGRKQAQHFPTPLRDTRSTLMTALLAGHVHSESFKFSAAPLPSHHGHTWGSPAQTPMGESQNQVAFSHNAVWIVRSLEKPVIPGTNAAATVVMTDVLHYLLHP